MINRDAEAPHDLDAERAYLSSVIFSPEQLALYPLRPEWFYRNENSAIYQAVSALTMVAKVAPDYVAITDYIRSAGLDVSDTFDFSYLMSLTESFIPATENTPVYQRIIREHWLRRALFNFATQVAMGAWEKTRPVTQTLSEASAELAALGETSAGTTHTITARAAADSIARQGEEYSKSPLVRGQVRNITTGFLDLNTALGGWRRGCINVVFAPPAVGKTYFNLHTVMAAAQRGHRVLMFSLEMSAANLTLRLALAAAKVPMHQYERGAMTAEQWQAFYNFIGPFSELPIVFNDTTSKLSDIVAVINSEHLRQPLSLVVIENLSLVEGIDVQNRSEAYGALTRVFKLLAGALNISIIVSHHMSDKIAQQRSDKAPEAGDVFASSEINQKVDVLLGMSRPQITVLRVHVLKDKVGGRAQAFVDLAFDPWGGLHDLAREDIAPHVALLS